MPHPLGLLHPAVARCRAVLCLFRARPAGVMLAASGRWQPAPGVWMPAAQQQASDRVLAGLSIVGDPAAAVPWLATDLARLVDLADQLSLQRFLICRPTGKTSKPGCWWLGLDADAVFPLGAVACPADASREPDPAACVWPNRDGCLGELGQPEGASGAGGAARRPVGPVLGPAWPTFAGWAAPGLGHWE